MNSVKGNQQGFVKSRPWKISALLGVLLAGFGVSAHAVTIYVANGDSDTAYIVDTDAGTFTSFNTADADIGYAIAVRDSVILGDRDDGGAAEYALDGTPTGNTWVGDGNFSQMLDGTTDGANNYAAVWSSTGVVIADANWQGSQILFDPGFPIIGITYDPTDNSLWVVNDNNTSIHQFALDGTPISSFDAALPGRDCCLSYDPVNDSLWVGVNGSDTVYEFAKDGTQLSSATITGWNPGNIWGAEIAGATEVEPTALFQVSKTFSNGATGDVEVTLTCNGGIPLTQNFTISGGGPGVTFTVTNLPDTGADCAVTESGGPDGYTADLSACAWTGVTSGLRTCVIENVPESTAVTVATTIETDDPTIDDSFTTTISCDSVNPDPDDAFGAVTVTDSSGLFEADWYADPDGGTTCTVATVFASSAIEPSSCTFSFAIGDEEAGCDVSGTVFFEGIPTLSQYGLALMALLMLGVGFVGMRRFV